MRKIVKKHLATVAVVVTVWLTLSFICWFKAPDEMSVSERRKLQQLPDISLSAVMSGKFAESFDVYTLDQFPFRDLFRRLKAQSLFGLYLRKDSNGIYVHDGYAAKLEYPLNAELVSGAAEKFSELYEEYIRDKNARTYLCVVPDKGYYLAGESGRPEMDYEKLFSIMKKGMPYAGYIDITDLLEVSDYYRTDTHWRQDRITSVAERIADAMSVKISGGYNENDVGADFYGVYYGQSALPLSSERIIYLSNSVTDACRVYNFETDEWCGVYDMRKADSRDPYEIFLSGASPLLKIENPLCPESRRLVVFRDSFASSLVPLLCGGYSEIVLADTRYISPGLLGNYINCENSDVLFIYSTLILNASTVLK